MANHTDVLNRIIREEIFTLANELVQELSSGLTLEGPPSAEMPPEAMIKNDYRGAVVDEIRNGSPDMVRDLCEQFGYEPAANAEDVLSDIEADGNWEEVADYLGIEPQTVEALQFWLVSDWLARRLEESDALVAQGVLGLNIWGRTECGQGLDMDADLRAVAARCDTTE